MTGPCGGTPLTCEDPDHQAAAVPALPTLVDAYLAGWQECQDLAEAHRSLGHRPGPVRRDRRVRAFRAWMRGRS